MADDDVERLRAALAARLQQMGIAVGDPRVAQLQAQAQALMQQQIAAGGTIVPFAPKHAGTRDDEGGRAAAAALETLPTHLQDLVQSYFHAIRSSRPAGLLGGGWFIAVPALAASEAGRKLLNLSPADKAHVAAAAYAAWTGERFGGPDGARLGLTVDDLQRGTVG